LLLGLGLQSSVGCSAVSSHASSAFLTGPRLQPMSPVEAEQTANEFVDAFNTGDPKAMTRFAERHSGQSWPQPPEKEAVARYLQLFSQMGPLRMGSIIVGESTATIRALAEKDGWVAVTLFFDPKSSTRVTGRRIEPSGPVALASRPSGPEVPAGPAHLKEQLTCYLDGLERSDLFSGVVVVAKGDQILFQGVHGMAERGPAGSSRPNQIDTKFDVASVGKMFTAVAIMQLLEAGRLTLDDAIQKHVPDYPNADARSATIRSLLTHTSGLGDFFGPRYSAARAHLRSPADFIALAGGDRPAFAPGTQWRYSNLGYEVLGRIIENVSGLGYGDYLRRYVFDPQKMHDTGAFAVDEPLTNRAVHYTHRGEDGQWHPDQRWPATRYGLPRGSASGGLYSTAPDLVKFGRALLGNGLLSAKGTRDLLAGKVKISAGGAVDEKYGYGFTESWARGIRHVGHTGETLGVNASFDLLPEFGYIVVVLTNHDGPMGSWVGARAVEWIVEVIERDRLSVSELDRPVPHRPAN
jgi:D-alanyl-D-alanine carboxypeptidase